MNTSSEKITVVIEKADAGFLIYDDTKSFIDVVHINDVNLIEEVVASIVRDRINGNQSSSIW